MKARTLLLAAAGMALSATAAVAVNTGGVSDKPTNVTVTGSSGNCLAVASLNARRSLTLDATGATANIGYCRTTPGGAQCTASIGTVGTTTLAAGSMHYWPEGSAPQNQFCFIAASGSQPLTIIEGF
jgi:hypothetical protein